MTKTIHSLLIAASFSMCLPAVAQTPLPLLQQSHVQANSPEPAQFHALLKRDLNSYFAAKYKQKFTLQYEMLRHGPTQCGAAYPKYYVWITLRFAQSSIGGAVRVAAIDKVKFQITDFVSADQIRKRPTDIETVFPALLCPAILQHARAIISPDET